MDVAEAAALDVAAGDVQHPCREINAYATVNLRAQKLEDSSGAGTNVEKFVHRRLADHIEQPLLDFLSRHVPLRSVPVWSHFLEIGLRLGCASCSHLIEPSIVAIESRVGRWHQVDKRSCESSGFGVVVMR